MKQILLNVRNIHRQNFENFIIGDNSETVCALNQLATTTQPLKRFLHLYGFCNSGKTHLLRAVARRILNSQYFDSSIDPELRGASAKHSILLIDNIENLNTTGKERLVKLYYSAQQHQVNRWLLASRNSREEIEKDRKLSPIIQSFSSYPLYPLSDQQIFALLQLVSQKIQIPLSDSILRVIFHQLPRDIPLLLYCLQKIDQLSLELKKPITLPFVHHVLKHYFSE